MDIRIIVETQSTADIVVDSLKRQQLETPLSFGALVECDQLSSALDGFEGVVFLATSELSNDHIELISQLRKLVSCDSKIALVSTVPTTVNHGIVLKAIRAGACDIISVDEKIDDEIGGFLSRLSVQGANGYCRSRVLTIVPCSSASDANFLAANFATLVAAHSRQCGVLDFHFRGSDLAILLQLTPRHTILDLLNQAETIDEAMFRQAISIHENGVELLCGPPYFSDLSNVRLQACQQIIHMAQHCWPVAVINTEDVQHAEQIRALSVSDEVILTMRLDVASLHRAQKHVAFLIQNHVPAEHIHICALGTGHTGEISVSAALKVLQTRHVYNIPDDPVAMLMSINIGNPLVTESPNSKTAAALKSAVSQIMGYPASARSSHGLSTVSAVKAASMLAINSLYR